MFYDSKRVSKFSLVSISVTAVGNKWYFPDQPQLRGKKIQKIVAYDDRIMPFSPDNVPLIQGGSFADIFLILYVNDREDIKMPCSHLFTQTSAISASAVQNNNGYIPLFDLPIVWEKSYVNAPGSYTPLTSQEVFMFGVFYQD
jgi:hypothetical protein